MVTIIGNGHGIHMFAFHILLIEKVCIQLFSPAMGKIIGQTGLFNLGLNGLKGKLQIQTCKMNVAGDHLWITIPKKLHTWIHMCNWIKPDWASCHTQLRWNECPLFILLCNNTRYLWPNDQVHFSKLKQKKYHENVSIFAISTQINLNFFKLLNDTQKVITISTAGKSIFIFLVNKIWISLDYHLWCYNKDYLYMPMNNSCFKWNSLEY